MLAGTTCCASDRFAWDRAGAADPERTPKPILAQVGLEGSADLQVRHGVIEIRPVPRDPRAGWAENAQRLAGQGGDALVWPELDDEGDGELVW
jgi:antitoxin MazE